MKKNQARAKIFVLCMSVILLGGCAKESFVYQLPNKPSLESFRSNIREIKQGGQVDVLWVIDNSGSMSTFQNNVIVNTDAFMKDFIKYDLKWKMGLISTDISDSPYLGFLNDFNESSGNPVSEFQGAVSRLGTSGSGDEMTFSPILKALTSYPSFLRNSSVPLAVLMVTDAEEQSGLPFSQFINDLKQIVGDRRLFVYGVLGSNDFHCDGEGFNYAGSAYEQFVNSATLGRAYPICTNFGTTLAQIGSEITQQVTRPTIFLSKRPKTDTLTVSYRGEVLPGGLQADGGMWYYDYELNAIVFYSLSFSTFDTDAVDVKFTEDVSTGVLSSIK